MNTYGNTPLRILLDDETRIAAIDGQLAAELGYDVAELLDASFSSILPPGDVGGIGTQLVELVTQDRDVVSGQHALLSADGAHLPAALSMEARRSDAAGFIGFSVAVLLDDNHVSVPATLPDHLRRLQAPAALIDARGQLIDTNLAWGQLFASPAAVTPGGELINLVHEGDRDSFRDRFGDLVEGRATSIRSEQRCLAEGEPIWCRLALTAFDSQAGLFTVTAEDISTEHLTSRVLLANEALFRSLAESSPVGLARVAADLSITYASPSWLKLTGQTDGPPDLTMADVLHSNGRERALTELAKRIADHSSAPVRSRLKLGDGERWASLRIASVQDEQLGTMGHVITIEDITDLVQATESQSQLAGMVEASSDLVGIADLRTGLVSYLNRTATDLFAPDGLTDDLHVSQLYPDDYVQRYFDEIYPVLRRGETWTGEVTMIRHDGKEIRIVQTVAAEIGADGNPERASVLGHDVTDERAALDELAFKATHDPLTGLPNRTLLMDHIQMALARSERDRTPVAVLFIDLDRFKTVNDTYGHDAGDTLLRKISTRMSGVLRPSDTIARLGGDEFVVVCEDIDGEVDAMTIAGRIRSAIEDEPMAINDVHLQVSASVGIAMSNGGSTRDPDILLQRADTAMYRAKNSGRARTELFDDVLRDRNQRRSELLEQLRIAIADDALEVHYQPLVDLRSGRVVGVEALVRWLHPVSGLLLPSDFLPLAIETGLDETLDANILHRACTSASRWFREMGQSSPAVHVNVSSATLASGQLSTSLETCLRSTGLPPEKLCIELSESLLMTNGDTISDRLAELKALRVRLAIDDVGVGATVLSRLTDLPLDLLKIDGAVISGLGTDPEAKQLVAGIVALSRALNLEIGAEAVEDNEAIKDLQALGVDIAQGHVFSAPIPEDRVEPLLTLRSTIARQRPGLGGASPILPPRP